MKGSEMVTKFHNMEEYINILSDAGILLENGCSDDTVKKIVRYISFDSQDIRYNTLFICKGAHFKREYLKDALDEGAFAYISETKYDNVDLNTPYIIVSDIRKAMILIADLYYNKVWENLTVIGITGTKGKSTTTYFLKYIIDEYMKDIGRPESAVISGIDNYDGIIKEESHLTTPEAMDLYKHFDNAVSSGIKFLSMEVSSQALKYDRVSEIIFDVGCFLNIGEDHISDIEHPDFEDYLAAKMKLFDKCRCACINMEDEYGNMAFERAAKSRLIEKNISFGRREGVDIMGYEIVPYERGIRFKVKCDSFDEKFVIGMRGLFNVDNALAAIAASYAMNIPIEHIKAGLKKARVSGRMEIFNDKDGRTVIVDYAHNKMSFESLFKSMRSEFPCKKVTIVFGCPGYKALGRRKELGSLAGEYTDKVYITEEDAGEEPVMKISKEIAGYVSAYDTRYEILTDRQEAITKAIEEADADTVVLITGKGRETRQKRGTQYIDTPSDVQIVEALLDVKE